MQENDKSKNYLIWICLAVAGAIFLLDISIPLGVAGGVPYVLVVLISLSLPCRKCIIYFAVLGSALTVIGFYTSPAAEMENWMVLANRSLALFAIWSVAFLGLGRRRAEDALKEANDLLEERVERRTQKLIDEVGVRRLTEEALRESEEKYRALFEDASESIYLIDAGSGQMVDFNDRAFEVLGYTREEFKRIRISDFEVTESPDEVLEHVRKIREEGSDNFETRHRAKEGDIKDVLVSARLISIGDRPYILSLISDITGIRRAEESLRESEEKYRTLLENLPQKVFLKDRDSVYISCNKRYADDLGISMDDIRGKTDFDFYAEEMAEKYRTDDEKIMDSGETEELEESYIYKGEELVVHTIKTPVFDAKGEVVALHGIFWDVTEKKRAEEALKRAHDNLERKVEERTAELSEEVEERKQAEESLKDLLAEKEVLVKEIHHRVKNNLQVITSLLNLQSQYIDNEAMKEIFKESQSRIKTMAMIHEKLYQSRDLSKIDFADYVKNLTASIFSSYRLGRAAVRLSVDIPDTVLDIDTCVSLGLIINELCTNSLKHAFPEGRDGEISIELSSCIEDSCVLIVKDDGIGLPEGFETKESDSMGLQLIDSMVAQLGGEVEVTSDGGASFKITFTPSGEWKG
ncbi:MAG: PAS domain S-box protein [Thermodesulfobacteriota bacterium]